MSLLTTSYVLVETFALAQARLGLSAATLLHDDVVAILRVVWVDEALHRAAATALLTAQRRHVSLVDCVSFEAVPTELKKSSTRPIFVSALRVFIMAG